MTENELEGMRLQLLAQVNEHRARDRVEAEDKYGTVWDVEEFRRDFDLVGFMEPFVVVKRKSDGKKGSLFFQHHPRFYHGWQGD